MVTCILTLAKLLPISKFCRMRREREAEACDRTCAIEEEQCFKRHLQSAAQCSVASSNNKFGYFDTRDRWTANRCCRKLVDWFVLRACSITLRTEANRVWEWSAAATTCSTTVSVSRTIMETSVAKLPSMCDSSSGSQCSEALLGSMQSGGSLPELWVPFQRLPEPSMLGEGGPPLLLEPDPLAIFSKAWFLPPMIISSI